MTPTAHLGFRTPGPANHLRGDDTIPTGGRAAIRPVRRVPALAAITLVVLCLVPAARGQGTNQTPTIISGNVPPGVYIDADGTVRRRQIDAGKELTEMKARAKAAAAVAKDEKFCYVSLPKVLDQVRSLRQAGKPVPEELQYLGGLTQIRYVFVYPEEKDLVVAGPAEPWNVVDPLHAFGKRSGRPVMRVEDFVVAMRTVRAIGPGVFGCALDPDPDSLKNATDIQSRLAGRPRAERMQEIVKAMGPQKVRIFGTEPDTRFAFTCVAADYELKRYGLGLAQSPVAGIGHGVDATRTAANKWWFELNFEPILVSPDGNAYGLRGSRLKVLAGGFDFDPRGATDKAKAFAQRMTKNIEALSAGQPLFADLQNLADLTVAAALIQREKLDRKVEWETSWLFDDAGCPVTKVAIPKTAETLVNYTNGAIAAGGVRLIPAQTLTESPAEKDERGALDGPRQQALKLRQGAKDVGPIVRAP